MVGIHIYGNATAVIARNIAAGFLPDWERIAMIDAAYGHDRNEVLDFLGRDPDLSVDNARFCVEKSDHVLVYRNGVNSIVGCATYRLWGEAKNKADAYIYVAPEARCAGVGDALLKSLKNVRDGASPVFLSTRVETNHQPSLAFFHRAGFLDWYTELILSHSGERQPESRLEFVNYRSEHFERYVHAMQRSFYELRSSNDFKPYICCQPDEAKRIELEQNKDHIYLLMDGEQIAASVIVGKDSIEDVFVVPEYQGKGFGRKLMWFALNKAIDNGSCHITLSAIEWNTKALRLYESVGFHVAKTICFLRFMDYGK